MYEDKKGHRWFGVSGGASRYDGKTFRNYILDGEAMQEDRLGITLPDRQPYEVNAIVEDRAGRFWFASRGNTFVYDGTTFTVFTHEGQPFKNVRSLIEDQKGNIWLGGPDGLWRYDGRSFTQFTRRFVGHIMEDTEGNIWTSSEKGTNQGWSLSRYDGKTLSDTAPTVTEIAHKEMIFGILEADDGSIWFGALDGVYRYDGQTARDFRSEEGQE